MKIEKKIVIEEKDVSDLHSEITDVIDFFVDNAVGGAGGDFVKTEFPYIMKLKRLLETVVLGEPSEQIYERLGGKPLVEDKKENRLTRHLKVIKMIDGKGKNLD